jgi:hypothetical protein
MLYSWARASLFARDRGCKMLSPQWTKVNRVGPWLRRERDKRYYFNLFTNEGYVSGFQRFVALILKKQWSEGNCSNVDNGVVVFKGLGNYLADFSNESEYLKQELLRITSPQIKKMLASLPERFVGVHVRRGDFAACGYELSIEYYVKAINYVRNHGYSDCSFLVFSDASLVSNDYFKDLPQIRIMPSAPALHDLLALSRASVLIGTNRSTFSEWGAFLGGMQSVWSKDAPIAKGLKNIISV